MKRTPQQRGRASREKGARFERAVVMLAEGHGLPARTSKNPRQDGTATYRSDVIVAGLRFECKHREDLTKELWTWLAEHDVLVLKRNSKRNAIYSPLAVLPLERLLKMLSEVKE